MHVYWNAHLKRNQDTKNDNENNYYGKLKVTLSGVRMFVIGSGFTVIRERINWT